MDVRVTAGDIAKFDADLVVVNLFEGVSVPGGATGAVDQALGGAISQLIQLGDIRGKAGELTTIHTLGKIPAPRVLVAGLGKSRDFDVDAVRNLAANVIRAVRKPGIRRIATIVHGAGIGGLDPAAATQAVAEGSVLGDYRFLRHKAASAENGDEKREIESLTIVEHDESRVAAMTA
ncbi:MAG: M17 family peptidase N-terminal domain-containing protein, partial [Hyphomicrobiales bacterium]